MTPTTQASTPRSASAGDGVENETFVINNPDGSISLDAYAGKSRDELKEHCSELVRALNDWQFAAMSAATDGLNKIENVREPFRSKIANLIDAYSDDEPAAPASNPLEGKVAK